MANMSYCRFRNTFEDLLDCYENMDDNPLDDEKKYRYKLLQLCDQIARDFVVEGEPIYPKN